MRPSNKSRSRNKSGGNGNHNQRRSNMGNIVNRVFESAGPDGKVRGTPQQIIDKYQALARDAQVSGDRVAAESYLQHSEHYSRLLGEAQRQQMESRYNDRDDGQGGRDDGFGGGEQRRQPQQPAMAVAPSGLAMIEPEDTFDAGPVETPEGRRAPVEAPRARVVPMQPAPPPQAAPNGGDRSEGAPAPQPAEAQAAPPEPQAPEAEAEAPQPPKRTRSPRTRRPKAEAPAPDPGGDESAAQAS